MDNKAPFDRGLLIPIILGLFSVCGICLVLLLGRLSASRSVAVIEESATPFKYLFLGTEPGISTSTPEDESTAEVSSTPIELEFLSPTSLFDDFNTLESGSATEALSTRASPSATTPTSSSNAPLNPGTYDQNDTHIAYQGDWVTQTGVAGVFQNTLNVSNTLGNSLDLRFIGEQLRIFYQAGPGLGTIRITLDGLQFDLSQSATSTSGGEWVSPLLINGTHTVSITHASGGSVNFDSFIVPDLLKTPTATPTP